MGSYIFQIGIGGKLRRLDEEEFELEDRLQQLLVDYPDLLAGDQIDENSPRRWLLVEREVGVPDDADASDRWSLDHLFLDQDGVPTLVEVKRSSDTRIRREVVGQMLDYAANAAAFWSFETVVSAFENRCEREGHDPDEILGAHLEGVSQEKFWEQVKTNLKAARLRLVFVADRIPPELRRIVEFLSEQMDPVEVFAVELRRFAGEGIDALVPRVYGRPKPIGPGPRETREWDKNSILSELEKRNGGPVREAAEEFFSWAENHLPRLDFGSGVRAGSAFVLLDHGGEWHCPVAVWTYGVFAIQFAHIAKRNPFKDRELREGFLSRLNEVAGISLPQDSVDRLPTIKIESLLDSNSLAEFFLVLEWYVDEVKKVRAEE